MAPYTNESSLTVNENLDNWVEKYSERFASSAIENVAKELSGTGRRGGGTRTSGNGYMFYPRRRKEASQIDKGSIGEGVAGSYFEKQHNYDFFARPFDTNPDIIFYDNGTNEIHLVQVKAFTEKKQSQNDEVIDLIRVMALTKHLRRRTFVANFVWVHIRRINLGAGTAEFGIYNLEIRERGGVP
jgi:hypothetical protein